MENKSVVLDQKLEVIDILKQALKIFTKNINFIIFTVVASLPLFFFSVYYEILLLNFLLETTEILKEPPGYFNFSWPIPFGIAKKLNKNFLHQLLQLGTLYLVPLNLLELSSVLVIVDLASEIYKENRSITLKDMIHKPIEKARLKGAFISSILFVFLSTCTLLGLIWLVTTYFFVLRNPLYNVFFVLVCGTAFVVLLTAYLTWSSLWNMSLVISILEGIYGAEAFALSAYFSRGNDQRGLVLMLVFFVWEVVLRLPCFCFGCTRTETVILVQIGLSCLGNALKWVASMVYFFDCKNRVLEKKVDEELGRA
ncbi:hypothetical protein UlMin_040319 [Ulmus minor]